MPSVDVLREKIIFHAFEVESVDDLGNGDYELDIKILPDRAGDAKDERGMAREIAALFKLNLVEPDVYTKESGPVIHFSAEKISALIGREVILSEITNVFDAYHYHYDTTESTVTLFVPPWRNDITNVHDICDEIGRYVGYDTVPAVLPNLPKVTTHAPEFDTIMNKKADMVAQGYNEVMTYSLVKKGDFQVAKGPKGKDFLRTNLLDGLRAAYAVNKQNKEILPNHSAKIFEIGKVFPSTGEELHVAWIDEKGRESEEVLTSDLSKGQTLSLQEQVGHEAGQERFHMWSEYPFMTRDIAVWLPSETSVDDLISLIKENGTGLLQGEPRLFDQFSKDGRTSYGIRSIFQAYDRTLTDDEVNTIMATIVDQVRTKGWEVR